MAKKNRNKKSKKQKGKPTKTLGPREISFGEKQFIKKDSVWQVILLFAISISECIILTSFWDIIIVLYSHSNMIFKHDLFLFYF